MSRLELPSWARVTEKRLAHIERVTDLLDAWARALAIPPGESTAWRDAGRLHDALRDADEQELRQWAGTEAPWPLPVLHGPAAAARLVNEGEQREDVLEAVRWHTLGHAGWARTGRALFMADFLEPGRSFARAERAFLARSVPSDFEGVFRQVVQLRMEWALRDGKPVFPETAELWNEVV
jgi:2-amino-4-hydroxy-6-hydroxymethyldihydropteridine diphosphokinase